MFVSYRKCFGRMNENSYITHEKPPHKTMRVHSTQKRDAGLSGLFVLITKDSPPNAPPPPTSTAHPFFWTVGAMTGYSEIVGVFFTYAAVLATLASLLSVKE